MHRSAKWITLLFRWLSQLSPLACFVGATVWGQMPGPAQPWTYLLLNDSFLLDDCPVCARPSIQEPLRGSFQLRLVSADPISAHYAVEDIQFSAGARPYHVTGGGSLEISGEVAVTLQMALQVVIDDGFTNMACAFTNTTTLMERPLPMLDITLLQTNGTLTRLYNLRIAAAPVRDIWFSTAGGFTATSGQARSNYVAGGDLLSTAGSLIKRNADLFTAVGAYPPVPDLGLVALDMLPGGEIAFALESDILSNTLGPLHHGDLLSNKGRILRRNQELLAAFSTDPATNDAGLDAVHLLDSGECLFSIETNVFSKNLNTTLHHGDLLSSTGAVLRSNQQLLARFHPVDVTNDHGLDALYIWPSGEIWFSTKTGFLDSALGDIGPGDLLSDQGYLVFKNSELLRAFAPAGTPGDLGLDALYVVTDATPSVPGPVLAISASQSSPDVNLAWRGPGRVFQLERAETTAGPFQPLSPIQPDLSFVDPGALTNLLQSFYRLRQW